MNPAIQPTRAFFQPDSILDARLSHSMQLAASAAGPIACVQAQKQRYRAFPITNLTTLKNGFLGKEA
jgi:hypothetical protein